MKALLIRELWSRFTGAVAGRKFVFDVGALSAANVSSAAIVLLQGIMVARWLQPEQYGTAALVLAYPQIVSGLLSPRSRDVSVNYLSEFHSRGERERVLAMCKLGITIDVLVAAATFVVVLVSASWAADRFVRDPSTAFLMILLAASFVPGALAGTSYAALATLRRFEMIAGLGALTSAVNTALILGLVFNGWGVAGVAIGAALGAVGSGFLYLVAARGIIRRTWGGSVIRADLSLLSGRIGEIARQFAYNHLSRSFISVLSQLDLVALGYFRGPTEAGYYKLAKRLATGLRDLSAPLSAVTYPAILPFVHRSDHRGERQAIRKLAVYAGVPLGATMLVGVLLVPVALPLLAGSSYSDSVPAMQILMIGAAVGVGLFWLRPVFFARGRFSELLVIDASVALLSGAAYCLVVPAWGYMAMAAWWTVAECLSHAAALAFLARSRVFSRNPKAARARGADPVGRDA